MCHLESRLWDAASHTVEGPAKLPGVPGRPVGEVEAAWRQLARQQARNASVHSRPRGDACPRGRLAERRPSVATLLKQSTGESQKTAIELTGTPQRAAQASEAMSSMQNRISGVTSTASGAIRAKVSFLREYKWSVLVLTLTGILVGNYIAGCSSMVARLPRRLPSRLLLWSRRAFQSACRSGCWHSKAGAQETGANPWALQEPTAP